MSGDCRNKNPLQRSGVNQYQRVLKALLPDSVKVDEKEYPDLILFAKNYATWLKYYKDNNSEDGDWRPFVTMDISVTLASLIRLDIRGFYTYTKDIFDQILATPTSQESDLKKYFKTLFDLGFSVTKIINDYYLAIPEDFDFREVIGNAVHSSLPAYLDRLQKYYKEAILENIIDPAGTFTFADKPDDLILAQNFDASLLPLIWSDSSVAPFSATFNGGTTALKIKNTATHNLFTGVFDAYLKVLSDIVKSASTYFDQTLSDFPTHSPHYALYLTFLKLFKFAQDHLNGFTARHLDLYYKDILRLNKQNAQPDNVHLVFELSKTADDSYLMERGTVFKAGKDIDGKEIFYDLKDDVVLGKGKVASLKNLFLDINDNDDTRQLFASSVANSADGKGAGLKTTDKSWKPFGDTSRDTGEVGFVVASDYLYLQEGQRTITFKFYAPAGKTIDLSDSEINNAFTLKLSGQKGWVDAKITKNNVKVAGTKEYFSIKVSINSGEQEIIPYSQKIHGYDFDYQLPMALFHIEEAKAKGKLWDFKFEKIRIDVAVSGVKNLEIENDNGVLNPAKPFDLFGAAPFVGSTFLVGSKELFMKTLKLQPSESVKVSLNLAWDNYNDLTSKYSSMTGKKSVDIDYLKDSIWQSAAADQKLFDVENKINYGGFFLGSGQSKLQKFQIQQGAQSIPLGQPFPSSSITFNLSNSDVEADFSGNESYSTKSKWGFFRLVSNDDFGHAGYMEGMVKAAQNVTITTNPNGNSGTTTTISLDNPPPEPYTPVVKEISLDYSVSKLLDFSANGESKVLHITPFGFKDINAGAQPVTLLPRFDNEGELFIGFEKLLTDQTLPILFQVAEGSANPLTEKEPVQWYYLGQNNEWTAFGKEDIVDSTNGLIKSGIIKFSISGEAVAQNTLMGADLHWLRATVKTQTQAICNLIDVVAQASVAQFFDYKKTGNYYKQTLQANTISKLVIPEASVKKIEQPYASFGAKPKENDSSFYRRVSERLRHKSRAITMWDYERIVLQQFPEIYKVKCINHTQIIEHSTITPVTYTDNELKPGYSLVVPIPSLQNKNAYDPLRPYTSLGTLNDIKQYLAGKISPHVNLDVRNPQFEEIQLAFNVQYLTDDEVLYTKQLKKDIEQFMAPWAFDPSTDIEFGGKVSKSVLINFIEERPYVDYVSCMKMYQINENGKSNDIEEAIASSSRSVFVSVKSDDPVNSHVINETVCEC